MKRSYSTLGEIDEDLRILRLKREIYMEHIKYKINRTRSNFIPAVKSDAMAALRTVVMTFAIKKIISRLRKSAQSSHGDKTVWKKVGS